MPKLPFAPSARRLTALLAVCLVTAFTQARAQNPPANPAPAAAPGQSSGKSEPDAKANDEILAKAGKLYYSTTKAGLAGFDCAVHPDWRKIFLSAGKASAVAADDPRIVLLKPVKIALHARLNGSSSLDWAAPATPDKPLDQSSIDLLEQMHQATEQTLTGFLQFWTPFADGSAIPASAQGLEITKTENGYILNAEQGGTAVTEVLDKQLLLKQFKVVMKQATVDFAPAYKSTDKGLLVNSFVAHILPAGAPPEKAQEMRVEIGYQSVDGFPIPSELFMNVVNRGEFDFVLDGCTVSRQAK